MSGTRRKILAFSLVFLPLFVLCLWLYQYAQPVYQRAVVAAMDVGLHRLDPPMRIEIIDDGGWAAYTLQPDGTEALYWSRPGHNLAMFYSGLVLLPALLLATPVGLRRRLGKVAVGMGILYLLHVLAGLGLILSIRCLAEDPGVMVCQWGKTVGNTFGQVAAFVIWGVLTWQVWLPGYKETAAFPAARSARGGVLARNPLFTSACVLAVVLLGAAYMNHFSNDFQFREAETILDNLSIRSLGNTGDFFTDPRTLTTSPENVAYRPLLTLSHAADYAAAAAGQLPRQYHRTQFAMLLGLGVALVYFFRRVFDLGKPEPGNRYAALFGALLCCVHLANAGTVNSISARPDLAAALGITTSFCLYPRHDDRRRRYFFLLPMLLAALLSPLSLAFAPLLVVFAWLFEPHSGELDLRAAFRRGGPALLLGLALAVFLLLMGGSGNPTSAVGLSARALQQPFVWLQQAYWTVLPAGRPITTEAATTSTSFGLPVVAGIAFLVLLTLSIRYCSRIGNLRPVAFGLAWFTVTSAGVSLCRMQAGGLTTDPIFLPSIGMLLALVWLATGALRQLRATGAPAVPWIAAALAAAVIVPHIAATRERNTDWQDSETLWAEVLRRDPDNPRGLTHFGRVLLEQGRPAEAIDYLDRARIVGAPSPDLELAIANGALGRAEDAERHFRLATRLAPPDARSGVAFARWLTARGRGPEAIEQLCAAARSSPTSANLRWSLMNLHAAAGDEDALQQAVRETLAVLDSEYVANTYNDGRIPIRAVADTPRAYAELAEKRFDEGRWLDAAILYRHAARFGPGKFQPSYNLAWSRMKLGFYEGAAAAYKDALEIDPTSAPVWNDLGWALAQQGDFSAAASCFARALELDPTLTHARSNLAWAQKQSN